MSPVTGIFLFPRKLMGCNLRVGKFDDSASIMIFASTFHQAQVNEEWKRIKGLQDIGVSTLITIVQKLRINICVERRYV